LFSAGGIGVLLNVNGIKEKLSNLAPKAELKAIIDSSWLIDLPYSFLCNDTDNNTTDCIVHQMFLRSIE